MLESNHESEIRQTLQSLWLRFHGSDAEWTRATFEALRDLGVNHGYQSHYSKKAGGTGEFLWDLVWLEARGDAIVRMPLATESEWTSEDLLYDFRKLLLADAPMRLVILQHRTREEFTASLKVLQEATAAYHGSPCTFLAACWIYRGTVPSVAFESWRPPTSAHPNTPPEPTADLHGTLE